MKQVSRFLAVATALTALVSPCSGRNGIGATVAQSGSATAAPMTCNDVTTTALKIPALVVTSATSMPASSTTGTTDSYPAHCHILGSINQRTGIDGKPYAIGFDIRLPASGWNGKFFYSGDAGADGHFAAPLGGTGPGQATNALTLGYAVASSNGGHDDPVGFDLSFGLDPQARVDYGYNALGTLTPIAKKIVARFYANAPSRSYYVGCSKGGQSGLIAASRFADQFDGIVAGDPGLDLPKAAIAELYDSRQLLGVSGNIGNAFGSRDLKLVADQILAKCDALDGATDGMVNDLASCKAKFNFANDVPQCAADATPNGTCLSAAQKNALRAIFNGAQDSAGKPLYSDWPWDPGLVGGNWAGWKHNINPVLGPMAVGNLFSAPPTAVTPTTAGSYLAAFNFDTDSPLVYGSDARSAESPMSIMAPPDPQHLNILKAKGKLIVYHGAADPVFSVNHSIDWYKNLSAADPKISDYARLFVVPGMNHCGGGPATDKFDVFNALVNWVEKGAAPDSIDATVAVGNADRPASWSQTRGRPLCPYPKKAMLKSGATDLESASSFVCQ
jgi:feruloyl esterase